MKLFFKLNNTLEAYIGSNYDKFTENDKKVRKYAKTKNEYINNYISFHENMIKFKIVLRNDIIQIDQRLKKGSDKILNSIEWKFCILNDGVEDNLPHTINDVICLPKNFLDFQSSDRKRILLHEKIHIYQRKYPCETNILYIKYWKLTPFILEDDPSIKKRIRFNPDNNVFQYTYYDQEEDEYYYNIQLYNNSAKKLNDSALHQLLKNQSIYSRKDKDNTYWTILQRKNVKQKESPNEVMACLCTDIILNDKSNCFVTESWMNVYL